jgi:hypothetical protein
MPSSRSFIRRFALPLRADLCIGSFGPEDAQNWVGEF